MLGVHSIQQEGSVLFQQPCLNDIIKGERGDLNAPSIGTPASGVLILTFRCVFSTVEQTLGMGELL